MSNVLVTGGAGFIGSHVVDSYVDAGFQVTVVDNLTEQVHEGEPDYLNDEANYVWDDIRNRTVMTELLKEADILNHQASAVGVGQSMYEIEKYVDVNTLGTARILDILVEEEIKLDRMIVASSMSIYGEGEYHCPDCETVRHPTLRTEDQLAAGSWEHHCELCGTVLQPKPTPETKPRDSTSVYAVTKKDQEELSLSVGRAYGIPTVALRYFNVYGSRQSLENPYTGVCAIFSSRIKNGNPPLIFEDGHQTRDFTHVHDIARANIAATESETGNVAVNVGTGDPTSIRDVANTLIELYDAGDGLSTEIANEYREGDIRHCYADTTKASEVLGFEAQVGLQEGMRELVEWGYDQEADDQFEEAHEELEEKGLVGED